MKASELEFTYLLIKETDKKNNEQNLIVIQKKNGVLLLLSFATFIGGWNYALSSLKQVFYPHHLNSGTGLVVWGNQTKFGCRICILNWLQKTNEDRYANEFIIYDYDGRPLLAREQHLANAFFALASPGRERTVNNKSKKHTIIIT